MTAEQRAKVWELVDEISGIARKVDILAQDISLYRVNSQYIQTCLRVTGKLMEIAAVLETVGEPESK